MSDYSCSVPDSEIRMGNVKSMSKEKITMKSNKEVKVTIDMYSFHKLICETCNHEESQNQGFCKRFIKFGKTKR